MGHGDSSKVWVFTATCSHCSQATQTYCPQPKPPCTSWRGWPVHSVFLSFRVCAFFEFLSPADSFFVTNRQSLGFGQPVPSVFVSFRVCAFFEFLSPADSCFVTS